MHAQQVISKITGKPAPNEDVQCDAENEQQVINDDDRTQIEGRTGTAPAPAPPPRPQHDDHPAFPVEHRKFGNPAPLGLFGFAATTLMLGLYYIQARHITVPNMVVGMAFAFGGLAQLLAGMWEFGIGNTFGATVFSSYGGFWISYAIILFPPSGILEAYKDNMDDLNDAIGIFLMVWFIVSLIFFFGTFKSSVVLSLLLLFVFMGYLLLMIGQLRDQTSVLKAGGVFCCLAAFTAFYIGAAELHSSAGALCVLPVGNLKETSVHGLCTKKKPQ
ncbi:hypothetical protein FRC06_002565 [Ceratobasidium sp. 370]|nr:hypothetical protein FRC06_002565 [Ceratobasidium sp. 370]